MAMTSLVGNHALVDGNERLGLAGLIAFLGVNGRRLTLTNDDAYDLVIDPANDHHQPRPPGRPSRMKDRG